MSDLDLARQLLDLGEKWLTAFDVQDPFNNGSALRGFLSLKPDHRYGGLAITHVNNASVPQAVLATPKLHYPFDRTGQFHFPAVTRIDIYEKLDGTNVCAYRYRDAEGRLFATYKLRLFPVLRNGTWGPFLDMWNEMIARYPAISRLAESNNCSVSMELYGARNAHLVVYDPPLECAVLFGVDATGGVIPPSSLDTLGVPTAPMHGTLAAGEDPVARYAAIRESLEKKIQKIDDDKLRGSEGTVWYVTPASGGVVLFKCKPESVEAIHWVGGINKPAVEATCWNLLETSDRLDYEALRPLLLEEYTEEEIDRFRSNIDAVILSVNDQLAYRNRVLEAYRAVGISISQDKGAVMRALSTQFGRPEMKKVYTVIDRYGREPGGGR